MRNSNLRTRIFVSYSRRGNGPRWKQDLLRALHIFERHHLLDVWEDGRIRVSSFWDDDIKDAIASANCALVLLTADALSSEYIRDVELPLLAERQKKDKLPIFPVVCEPCEWKAHAWLRATQAPNESRPLSELVSEKRDAVFRQLATEIAQRLGRGALAGMPGGGTSTKPVPEYCEKFPL